jgi:ribonuclease Z
MAKRLILSVSVACFAFMGARSHAAALLARSPSAGGAEPSSRDTLRVILLGTGAGPRVDLQQFGAATFGRGGRGTVLFDCGRGATLRLAQAGVPTGSIRRLFLTHLHSDHVIQIPDLLLTGWVGGGRTVPLEVWGPEGTRDLMTHLEQAFAFDIHMRRDVDEKAPAQGIQIVSRDITEGLVLDQDGLKVTAFLVDHAPVGPRARLSRRLSWPLDRALRRHPCLGEPDPIRTRYRRPLHETLDAGTVRALFPNDPGLAAGILAKHTTPEQAGAVFARVKPRLAVYTHAPSADRVIAETRKTYSGPLQGAEDMLAITIGETIDVRRLAR